MENDGKRVGVCERVRSYALSVADRSHLTIEVDCDFPDQDLRPEVSFGVLRILQEALNNTVKHAQATQINVSSAREKMDYCNRPR